MKLLPFSDWFARKNVILQRDSTQKAQPANQVVPVFYLYISSCRTIFLFA
jgi:hypothetical protein